MVDWLKRNKLASVLALIVLYILVIKPWLGARIPYLASSRTTYGEIGTTGLGGADLSLKSIPLPGAVAPKKEYTPTTITDRLVVQESNLSLVTKNVRESADKIIEFAKSLGGYMVSSSLTQPEEAPFATVVLRIPAKDLKTALDYFRSLAVKVSSEYLLGKDVTDEYEDIEARLATLNKTKAKFEEILDRATQIQDILQVQRELVSLQNQIDSLKGRQQYLEKTAELAKITVYLSTDEFALPYAPTRPFRPALIFKQAVRSLVSTLRSGIRLLIWLVVYSVIWLPILFAIWFWRRRKKLP